MILQFQNYTNIYIQILANNKKNRKIYKINKIKCKNKLNN